MALYCCTCLSGRPVLHPALQHAAPAQVVNSASICACTLTAAAGSHRDCVGTRHSIIFLVIQQGSRGSLSNV